MGGILIVISIVVPTLLWADLTNAYVWVALGSLLFFAANDKGQEVRLRIFADYTKESWALFGESPVAPGPLPGRFRPIT